MRNINIEKLVALKNEENEIHMEKYREESKSVNIDHNERYERNLKYSKIKGYIEDHMSGIIVTVSGGKHIDESASYLEDGSLLDISHTPLIITTQQIGEKNCLSQVTLKGCILHERDYISRIYDEYIRFLLLGNTVKNIHVSNEEIFLSDLLGDTCLSECGFYTVNNQLKLFKDDKVYTIIKDIVTNVQGVIKVVLPNERDESIIVVCVDKTILLTDCEFYIDTEVVA